ncbi:uncharacterized protein LOC126817880 [Patella vulgata]|uniref:uncharacterized protein LOC126817880 n=1 Tax=Patella vulgata TaxID=6465 RepID=UPI00217F5357|nr:uncharacterized protein LOC126817880 [Patella vulgata]
MDVELHCDNCSGQNKNNYFLWYLAWRVMNNLHRSITMNFLITGHTKFAPDWCFGLIKQKYRLTMVSCLDDIANVVRNSTTVGINIAQKVGNEDGSVVVNIYDWQAFFNPFFRKMPGIKKYHHFRFDSNHPGMVFRKLYADSEEEIFNLIIDSSVVPHNEKPDIIPPPGLSAERQLYLYQKIREFCRVETRDISCPLPQALPPPQDLPESMTAPNNSDLPDHSTPDSDSDAEFAPPLAKRGRGRFHVRVRGRGH